jgi:hypothetical protein
MSPRHFSKQMSNPYFQTDHYRNESAAALYEKKIENKIKNFFKKFKFKKK